MRKNVAGQSVAFQMVSAADGSAVTAGTPTVYYTIDGGAQATGGGTATHKGNGQWEYSPLQAETNGDHVAFTMVLSGAITQTVNVYPVAFDPTDTVRLGLTALPNAAADAAGGLPISDAGGLDLDTLLNRLDATITSRAAPGAQMTLADGAITAAKIAAGALDNKGNWNVGKTGYSLSADQSGVTIGTVGTVTNGVTVSANNDKTGYSLSAGGVTAVQSGLATSAEVTAIQNTTRSKAVQPAFIERPDSGSVTPELRLFLYDTSGNMEDADSTPTIAITNSEGVDRSGNLSVVSHPGTGQYQVTYTVSDSHPVEHLQGTWSYVEGGNTIVVPFAFSVVDTAAVDFTSADRTKLEAVYDKLPSASYLTGTASADGSGYATTNPDNAGIATISGIVGSGTHGNAALKSLIDATNTTLGTPAGASLSADIASVKSDTQTLVGRITATLFDGITSLAGWLRLGYRKDAAVTTDEATALAEINADGGSGGGTFVNTDDAQEAIRDRGDAAWTTGAGGGGGGGSVQVASFLPGALDQLGGVEITYTKPTWDSTTWSMPFRIGNSYLDNGSQDSRASITVTGWTGPALTSADTVKFIGSREDDAFSVDHSEVTDNGGNSYTIYWALSSTFTGKRRPKEYDFRVEANFTSTGETFTLTPPNSKVKFAR